jgi:hypothetical protein
MKTVGWKNRIGLQQLEALNGMTIKMGLQISVICLWMGLHRTSKINTSAKFAAINNERGRVLCRRRATKPQFLSNWDS